MHKVDTEQWVSVNMSFFNGTRILAKRANQRIEEAVRMKTFKNNKPKVEEKVIGEMMKRKDELVINCIWKLCYADFESSTLLKDYCD